MTHLTVNLTYVRQVSLDQARNLNNLLYSIKI